MSVSLSSFAWVQLKGCADVLIAAIRNIPDQTVTAEDVIKVWTDELEGAAAIATRRTKALEAFNKATLELETLSGTTIVDGIAALTEHRAAKKAENVSTITREHVKLGILANHSGNIADDEKAAGLALHAEVEKFLGIDKAAQEASAIKVNSAGGLSHSDARKILAANGWTAVQSGADHTKKEYGIVSRLSVEAYDAAKVLAAK